MGLLIRLFQSVRSNGFWTTISKLFIMAADLLYDMRYGVDTLKESALQELSIDGDNRIRGTNYVPARVLALRQLFKILKPIFTKDRVFVDIGSGKGRVMMIASEYGVKEARGIEFAHELSELSKKNWAIYQYKTHAKTGFKVYEGDVVDYEIRPDEDIFFMNNPFDETVLNRLLDNLCVSLRQNRRPVFIIYFCPTRSDVIEQRKEFNRIQTGKVWGYDFALYTNS